MSSTNMGQWLTSMTGCGVDKDYSDFEIFTPLRGRVRPHQGHKVYKGSYTHVGLFDLSCSYELLLLLLLVVVVVVVVETKTAAP